MVNDNKWVSYATQKPPKAGIYRWRLHNNHLDLAVTFLAEMRERGAGFEKVVSPSFDWWDGYRVTVPKGTLWKPAEATKKDLFHSGYGQVQPEGVELLPCPFCGEVPYWSGATQLIPSGVSFIHPPYQWNIWWLKCCQWTDSPQYNDPRKLADIRNGLIL